MLRTAFGAMSKDLFEGAKMDIMEAETESVPLVNPATGKPVIIRRFEYDVPPYTIDWPTEEEIRYKNPVNFMVKKSDNRQKIKNI